MTDKNPTKLTVMISTDKLLEIVDHWAATFVAGEPLVVKSVQFKATDSDKVIAVVEYIDQFDLE